MKVLHINTFSRLGGAALATQRLTRFLNQHTSIESSFFAPFGEQKNLHPDLSTKDRLKIRANQIVQKLCHSAFTSASGLLFSYPKPFSVSLQNIIQAFDVIHFHWVQGAFLNTNAIASISQQKKTVWTFHDSFPLTGGCHTALDCEGFRQECAHCPQTRLNPIATYAQRQKNQFWKNTSTHIIAPSQWMYRRILDTQIVNPEQVSHLPNSIDFSIFTRRDKASLRKKYGIPANENIIFWAAYPSKTDRHKGANLLFEIQKRISPDIAKFVFLSPTAPNADTYTLPPTHDEEVMAEYFALADLYIHTSLDDNLPNQVMESLACGTPVIAFDVGGVSELVTHKKNGFLVTKGDALSFSEHILDFFRNENRENMEQEAVQLIRQKYAVEKLLSQLTQIYQNL